jgi:hypothetical protein
VVEDMEGMEELLQRAVLMDRHTFMTSGTSSGFCEAGAPVENKDGS